ncbi:MAG: PPC domain-containing protein, partial [Thermoplasmata archaeon]
MVNKYGDENMAWKVRTMASYVAIGTMLLAALFTMVGNVRADTEPNDSFTQAEQLTLVGGTVSVTGTVQDSTDINDYYKFDANAGEYITVTLSFDAANDFDLYLYDPLEDYIDYGWFDNPEICEGTAETTGTYYIEVDAYSGSGSYTLTVTLSEPPAGDGN